MNYNQKTYLRNWEKNTKLSRRGKKVAIGTIISGLYKTYSVTECDMPQLLEDIHPFLYMNFVIDWKVIPESHLPTGFKTGEELGRYLIKEWRNACWKSKYANVGELSVYESYNELAAAVDEMLDGNQYTTDKDFIKFERDLKESKIIKIENQNNEMSKKEDDLRYEADMAKLQGNVKHSQELMEKLRKEKKQNEAEQVRVNNRLMASKENSPWTADISKLSTIKTKQEMPKRKEATVSLGDVMPKELVQVAKECNDPFESGVSIEADDPFITESPSLLQAPRPEPVGAQVLFQNEEYICIDGKNLEPVGKDPELFSPSISAYISKHLRIDRPQVFVRLRKIDGQNYITIEMFVGTEESGTVKSFDGYVKCIDESIRTSLLSFYEAEDYVLLNISENVSHNPSVLAFKIVCVEEKR